MKSLLQEDLLRLGSWIGGSGWDWEVGSWDRGDGVVGGLGEVWKAEKVLVELGVKGAVVVEGLGIEGLVVED